MFMKYIKVIIRNYLSIWLLDGSFFQKVHFLFKMASGNQPGGVSLIQTKIQKLLKRIERMCMKCINVIFRDYSLI